LSPWPVLIVRSQGVGRVGPAARCGVGDACQRGTGSQTGRTVIHLPPGNSTLARVFRDAARRGIDFDLAMPTTRSINRERVWY